VPARENCSRCYLDGATSTVKCTECHTGFTWNETLGICKLDCETHETWKWDNTCKVCDQVHNHCAACEESTVNCTDCQPGYFLEGEGSEARCIKQCD
jgi:hypothetical protein